MLKWICIFSAYTHTYIHRILWLKKWSIVSSSWRAWRVGEIRCESRLGTRAVDTSIKPILLVLTWPRPWDTENPVCKTCRLNACRLTNNWRKHSSNTRKDLILKCLDRILQIIMRPLCYLVACNVAYANRYTSIFKFSTMKAKHRTRLLKKTFAVELNSSGKKISKSRGI